MADNPQSITDPSLIYLSKIAELVERIARAQEGMLAVAMEARGARLELSKKLQQKLTQPFEEESK